MRRFFVDALPEAPGPMTVAGDEAHHMLGVVRVRTGEEVTLFDGSGREARARLLTAQRREATLELLTLSEPDREPERRLTLACALPRTSRMDFLVEKCCELGVARLIPMVTQRSVVDAQKREANHLKKWRRTTIEAAKQCGRTRLTEIRPVMAFADALKVGEPDAVRLIASTAEGAVNVNDLCEGLDATRPVLVFIGPEGGFTPEEVAAALDSGCTAVSLGRRILRVETAAVAMAARLLLGD